MTCYSSLRGSCRKARRGWLVNGTVADWLSALLPAIMRRTSLAAE